MHNYARPCFVRKFQVVTMVDAQTGHYLSNIVVHSSFVSAT
jgi:hypothetical protein